MNSLHFDPSLPNNQNAIKIQPKFLFPYSFMPRPSLNRNKTKLKYATLIRQTLVVVVALH